ncbi:MAG: YafY family protein [Nitrospinae bacterium]|nr:YafY family protein [Nitrospinota bacterium]MDA1110473.1 YafY family protein [Nitrospinota bacterium]
MRRADRLFRIVEYLKARRQVVTAGSLAEELGVSVRTIYRDIADLGASGVPIIGEAGVGYMLHKNYVVRPLMFDTEELDALMLGAQMVQSWGDKELAKAANQALDKITSVLPESLRKEIAETFLFSMASKNEVKIHIDFTALRRAIRGKNIVEFSYKREDGEASTRRVRPLCLAFFSPVWLISGWCEMRDDFRNFRLDRIQDMKITEERFRDEKGKSLYDYMQQMC